jgi:exosome complex RNA-binding protein Rrp42 (RNase PH superfamily)
MSVSFYIPIRDNSGLVSLSKTERDFTSQCGFLSNNTRVLRTDGRSPNQLRPITLNLSRGDNQAVCLVQWG